MAVNQSEFAVHLEDDKGKKVVVGPGEDIPSWADVTNPYVLGHEEDESTSGPSGDGPPPKSGKGSGIRAWRAYADANGVDVEGLDSPEDVIDALENAGVPVE